MLGRPERSKALVDQQHLRLDARHPRPGGLLARTA
jgi:hypothetical protein